MIESENPNPPLSVTATTLAHFSDPHLAFEPVLSLRQRFSKRQLSALSWGRGRRELQQPRLLDALMADVRAAAPDHLVVTGDIVNFSLPGEFPAAARWLQSLGAPDQVSVVPGNHDALVPMAPEQGLGLWAPWMSGDDGAAAWPYLRVRGELALIGLRTGWPTAPLLAGGSLGTEQLQRLDRLLQEQAELGRCRVLMLHHPVVSGVVSRRKALADAEALRELIRRRGAELLLHGHARDAHFGQLRGPQGGVLSLGLPSSSAVPNPKDEGARWHLLRLEPAAAGWTLSIGVRRWDAHRDAFASAGNFRLRIPSPHPRPHPA
jgi:3',5'-cyclic AMP phosphodiesterase CpdA